MALCQNSNKSTFRIPQSRVLSPTLLFTFNEIYFCKIPQPKRRTNCTIWNHIISNIYIKKLQSIWNTALCIATGCTRDTNTQHLHYEINIISVLPMETHFKLHATKLKRLTQAQTHSLHYSNASTNKLSDFQM